VIRLRWPYRNKALGCAVQKDTQVAARDCGARFATLVAMERFLFFIGMNVGGAVGWWIGDCLGYGLTGEFLLSAAGSTAGIVVVWRIITSDRD